jgi:hypothetical protein
MANGKRRSAPQMCIRDGFHPIHRRVAAVRRFAKLVCPLAPSFWKCRRGVCKR